jgi:uncharacterized protein (TIGR03435 family)
MNLVRAFALAVVALGLVASRMAQVSGSQSPPAAIASATSADLVVSIKPNRSGEQLASIRSTPGSFIWINNVLRSLVLRAYGVRTNELVGVPEWTLRDRYDIVIKAEGALSDGSEAAVQKMLQIVLAERFNFRMHRELRLTPVYVLVTARSDGRLGPNLRPSTIKCEGRASPTTGRPCGLFGGPTEKMVADAVTMQQLALTLASFAQRFGIDRTGIPGIFDMDLSFTRDLSATDPDSPPNIFTAVKEQLGLELKPEHAPVNVLIIDNFDRPTPD